MPSFIHVYQPPSAPDAPTLLMLHGTGGDEHDLVPLASELMPGAAVLSPRDRVDPRIESIDVDGDSARVVALLGGTTPSVVRVVAESPMPRANAS